MEDIFNTIIALFENEGPKKALQTLLTSPKVSYDNFHSKHPCFHHLVNYLDACAFGDYINVMLANQQLQKCLDEEYDTIQNYLREEFQKASSKKHSPEERILQQDSWNSFRNHHPKFASLIFADPSENPAPRITFNYPCMHNYKLCDKTTPVYLIEPYQGDWGFLKNNQAVLVFESKTVFLQMLQFPEFVEVLNGPHHLIYLLDLYPIEQLQIQTLEFTHPFISESRAPVKDIMSTFANTLETLIQNKLNVKIADELYRLSYEIRFLLNKQRLGQSRIPALILRESARSWHDPNKVPAYEPSHFKETIEWFAKEGVREIRDPKMSPPFRIAHIVPQIIDKGHAPSRILENILTYHSKELFEITVISTEILAIRKEEYPYNLRASISSWNLAPERIAKFIEMGISVEISSEEKSITETAQNIAAYLKSHAIDIAVFHGPDLLNSMISRICDVPKRVFFEHGTPPSYPVFDTLILSTPDTAEQTKALWKKLEINYYILPFVIDPRKDWLDRAFSNQELGVPPDSFIMTTISNHLETRISEGMCHAIGKILQNCPLAYYMPIGPIKNISKHMQIFTEYGVQNRVRFLGSCDSPSQVARSMHLYLNEFPFGSCLGMIDAMAAGCPVITMYDPDGPAQARYGALFIGIEKTLKPDDLNGYIQLACRLYNDKAMYHDWSQHALSQYEKNSDLKTYVKNLEEILID